MSKRQGINHKQRILFWNSNNFSVFRTDDFLNEIWFIYGQTTVFIEELLFMENY